MTESTTVKRGGVGLLDRRRALIQLSAQLSTLTVLGAKGGAACAQGMYSGKLRTLAELIDPITNGAQASKARVQIKMPVLADNGNLVGLGITSTLPMLEHEYVQKIYLLSQRNPVVQMATFYLGPWSGEVNINTRVRLAGSQFVVALAQTSRGAFYYDQFDVIVTESACVDGS
jgi:sulfur-oxidizing protein SoxY